MLLHHQDNRLISAIHLYQRHKNEVGFFSRILCSIGKAQHLFWTVISGSDISRDVEISPSARFPHLTGVVIHQDAKIDENCLIMQQVTIGQTSHPGAPALLKGCYVGAGAKILGPVQIGPNARIGANAVVLSDVPAYATAVGIPARIILKTSMPDEA